VLIARLAAQLRCYVPEPVDEVWGRLRHLGARRAQLLDEACSQVQQMRALLECAWPASLDAARQPFRWATWPAAMSVILDRDGGDLARTRRLGLARFEAAVRREVIRRGRQKPCMRIVRQVFAALADQAGVIAHRPGALERAGFLMDDWRQTQHRLAGTQTRMTGILDDLQLTELVTSITGLSPAERPRSWPRPATRAGSPPPGPWSSTPAWRRGRNYPVRSPAARNSPARAGPACGWPPGGPYSWRILGSPARLPPRGLCATG
jgi:hypothetical protein